MVRGEREKDGRSHPGKRANGMRKSWGEDRDGFIRGRRSAGQWHPTTTTTRVDSRQSAAAAASGIWDGLWLWRAGVPGVSLLRVGGGAQ